MGMSSIGAWIGTRSAGHPKEGFRPVTRASAAEAAPANNSRRVSIPDEIYEVAEPRAASSARRAWGTSALAGYVRMRCSHRACAPATS